MVGTQAPLTCFRSPIALELCRLVLNDLTGLASASRRYIKIWLDVSILGSLLFLPIEKTPHGVVKTFPIVDRAPIASLLILVLMLTGFPVYYPFRSIAT